MNLEREKGESVATPRGWGKGRRGKIEGGEKRRRGKEGEEFWKGEELLKWLAPPPCTVKLVTVGCGCRW